MYLYLQQSCKFRIFSYLSNFFNFFCSMKKILQADIIGMGSSLLCLIHCLAMPFIFAGLALMPNMEWWEGLDYVFLAINFCAVYFTTTHTSVPLVKYTLWFGWALLATAIMGESKIEWLEYVGYFASFVLIVGHYINYKSEINKV